MKKKRAPALLRRATGPDVRWDQSGPRRGGRLQGVEELGELALFHGAEAQVAVACVSGFAIVGLDGGVDGGGAAVVEVGSADAQAPERSGAHVARAGGAVGDAVTEFAHVVEEQVRVERDGFEAEGGDGAEPGGHGGEVADGAAYLIEDAAAGGGSCGEWEGRRRGEQLHEVGGGVDVALAGGWVDGVFGVGDVVESGEEVGVAVRGVFFREDAASDAHFVEIGVGGEGEESGLLGFPAEAADAGLIADGIEDGGEFAADPVGGETLGIADDGGVRDGFDEAEAEERGGLAVGDDVGVEGDDFLAGEVGGGHLEERAAEFGERVEALRGVAAEAGDGDGAGSAGGTAGVAGDAGTVIEDGAEAAVRGFAVFEFGATLGEVC